VWPIDPALPEDPLWAESLVWEANLLLIEIYAPWTAPERTRHIAPALTTRIADAAIHGWRVP
jgi:hypothetical protein